LILGHVQESLDIFIVQKNIIILLVVAAFEQLGGIAHHYYAVPQHYQTFVMLFVYQAVVLLE